MKTKLLIIEDEAAIRDMIRFSLPSKEFELMEAESTTIATRALADQVPDLIVLQRTVSNLSLFIQRTVSNLSLFKKTV